MVYIPGNVPQNSDQLRSFLSEELNRIKGAVDQGDLGDFQSQIDDLQQQILTNTSDITQLQSDVAQLRIDVDANTSNIATLQTDVGNNTSSITTLTGRVDSNDIELADHETRITTLEDTPATTQNRYDPIEDHPDIYVLDGEAPSPLMWNAGDLINKPHPSTTRTLLAITEEEGLNISLSCTILFVPQSTLHNSWQLAVRMSYDLGGQYFIAARVNNGKVEVYQFIIDTFTLLGEYTPTLEPPFTLKLTAQGSNVTIEDDSVSHTWPTTLNTTGRFGYVSDYWNALPSAMSRNYIYSLL